MGAITVAFNNVKGDENLRLGWGLSLLVEDERGFMLFDTGPDAEDLKKNLESLSFSIEDIKTIVISHLHRDHSGGLRDFLLENPGKIEVYLPADYPAESQKTVQSLARNIYIVREKTKIKAGVYIYPVRGLKLRENVLVIDSDRGLILATGCAHPNVYRICRAVKSDFGKDILALLGGFHFEYYPGLSVRINARLLKRLGIKFIGPNHCTGEKATVILKKVFGDGFVDFGSGRKFSY